jgi:hypothetical protein
MKLSDLFLVTSCLMIGIEIGKWLYRMFKKYLRAQKKFFNNSEELIEKQLKKILI